MRIILCQPTRQIPPRLRWTFATCASHRRQHLLFDANKRYQNTSIFHFKHKVSMNFNDKIKSNYLFAFFFCLVSKRKCQDFFLLQIPHAERGHSFSFCINHLRWMCLFVRCICLFVSSARISCDDMLSRFATKSKLRNATTHKQCSWSS